MALLTRRRTEQRAAMRRAGRSVESKYYRNGRHNGIFQSTPQREDELKRSTLFLRRHLAL